MDDDDEYDSFFSGIDDAAAIAALAREEEKFAVATQRVEHPPPSKRQKLEHRTGSMAQYAQLPIMLGMEDDYFTRTRVAPLQQRNDDERPRPPPRVKQKPPQHPPQPPSNRVPTSIPNEPYNVPSTSIRPSAPVSNIPPAARPTPQRVVSDPHRIAQHHGQPSLTTSSSGATILSGPSSSQQKPHSAGPSRAPPQRQYTPQRQVPSANNLNVHARAGLVASPNAQRASPAPPTALPERRRPSAAGQVSPHQPPPQQPTNILKRKHSNNNANTSSTQQQAPRATQGAGNPDARLRRELEIMRVQLEQAQAREAELEKLWNDEKNARYAESGQVTVVKTNMEKMKQSHINEINRLKAARDEALAAKLELQKEQKAEIERLRSQFTFRQHELETSTRKAPFSAQSKKTYNSVLGTPIKTPAQIRAWNQPVQDAGPSHVAQTPRRPRFDEAFVNSSDIRPRGAQGKRPAGALPGFVNAFAESTPTKSASQRTRERRKGKLRESVVADDDGQAFFATPHARSPPSSPTPVPVELEDQPMEDAQPDAVEGPPLAGVVEPDGDVKMEGEGEDEVASMDVDMGIEPPDWREELHRLLFAHTAPDTDLPTLQMLLNSPLPADAPAELQQTYSTACTRLIEHFAIAVNPVDWDAYMHVFAAGLVELAWVMASTSAIKHLVALFDMLCLLCYSIPAFNSSLLMSPSVNTPPRIVSVLNHTIRTHLVPDARNDAIAHATLSMIEALSWSVPEDSVRQLSAVAQAQSVLETLLNPEHPVGVLAHAARMLTLLATQSDMYKYLLKGPDTEGRQGQEIENTLGPPHMQLIFFYLIDPLREGPEHDELKRNTLTLISTLALAHSDAYKALLQMGSLIPSLIIYLANISRPIWEDDEEFLTQCPGQLSRTVEQIVRVVALLHHLILTPDSLPEQDLKTQLYFPRARHLVGAGHTWIVALSRCAFADTPEWLDEEHCLRLEQAVGMAKVLIEYFVPEALDGIWQCLNAENDEEEEREAQRMHPADADME